MTTLVLGLAVVGFAVQQTAIVPAIQDVERSLHSSPEWAAWLVTVYLTVATVATLAMGRLADLHGRRRVLLVGLAIFAVGSIGAAAAPDMPALIVFRAVQGVGGAVYPLTLAIARDQVPEERVTRVISLLTASFGVGTAVGFVGGGLLAQYASWRWIFGCGALLVTAGALAVARWVRDSGQRARGGFDWAGTVVLAASAIALLVGLTVMVPLGAASPVTLGLLVTAAVFAAGWVILERRVEDPLVDLHVFGNRAVVVGNLATIGLGWALFSAFLLLPEYARASPGSDGYGLGADTAGVGLVLLPLAVGQTVAAAAAGRLVERLPSRGVYAAGLLGVTVATGVLAVDRSALWVTVAATLLLGAGAGTALQSASSVATEGVASDVASVSASVNSTVRRLSGGVGGQITTFLLAAVAVGSRPSFAAFWESYAIGAALCLAGAAVVFLGAPRH